MMHIYPANQTPCMKRNCILFLFLLVFAIRSGAQLQRVYGHITNTRLEPLAFASIEVKETRTGTISKEDGSFEMMLERGKYDLVISMIGYQPQVITIIVGNTPYQKNVILETTDAGNLSEVVVKGKQKDRAEDYIRQVIRHKDSLTDASGAFSCLVYIKGVQEDSLTQKKKRKKQPAGDTLSKETQEMNRMSMAEIVLKYDYESPLRTREERTGVTRRGKPEGLFYLSTTEGDFNFYRNLLKIPAVSDVPILSPVSYSGLLAYRFKTLSVKETGGHKQYIIGVRARNLSNATVEGEITIEEGTWAILHTRFSFPRVHLPEYDFFEVEQDYRFVGEQAWMITRQVFTYQSKTGRSNLSGNTTVNYRDFELNKTFDRKYFGPELSATTQQAYERDSSFWETNRTEPLTPKELRFIRYKDSVYTATHSKAYLDSLDRVINKVTAAKILWFGQTFNNHEKERSWHFQPLPSFYQPFQFGGARLWFNFTYVKTFPSRKNITFWNTLSYGFRNHDVNGSVRINRLYNPFNRGYFNITLEREFEYIFRGDAWLNLIKRSNVYLKNGIGVGHNFEIANGLFLYTDAAMAFRRSVADYKTNTTVDSLFGDILEDNQAVYFEPYNAFYGEVRLQYTPHQRYIREPKEKIILGSSWPTFYTVWRKGIPGVLNSKVDFDYWELGVEQEIKLGLAGLSRYTFRSGTFLSQKDLRLVDYKFQRRGDPVLFMNPHEAFQALDSTFPVFKRFYQAHYVHEFNGAIINKIPFMKVLGLREVVGAGFLYAPERKLTYVEAFAGIERVFKWPFNPLNKFKLGVYIVGSDANQFHNPVQFKIGITTWDRLRNKWN